MTCKLIRHELDFQITFDFVREALEKTNTLSCKIMDILDFEKGRFFTLLTPDAHIERLHIFESYILKQNPRLKYDDKSPATYQIIPTICDELCVYIISKLNLNNKINCVIDDFNATYGEDYEDDLFSSVGLFYENEVYYKLDFSTASSELILQCLHRSNIFWHSLCVLTEAHFDDIVI